MKGRDVRKREKKEKVCCGIFIFSCFNRFMILNSPDQKKLKPSKLSNVETQTELFLFYFIKFILVLLTLEKIFNFWLDFYSSLWESSLFKRILSMTHWLKLQLCWGVGEVACISIAATFPLLNKKVNKNLHHSLDAWTTHRNLHVTKN